MLSSVTAQRAAAARGIVAESNIPKRASAAFCRVVIGLTAHSQTGDNVCDFVESFIQMLYRR